MFGREPKVDIGDLPQIGDVPLLIPWLLKRPDRMGDSLAVLLDSIAIAGQRTLTLGAQFASSPEHGLLEVLGVDPGSPTADSLGKALSLGMALAINDIENRGNQWPNEVLATTHGALVLALIGYSPDQVSIPAEGLSPTAQWSPEMVRELILQWTSEDPDSERLLPEGFFIFLVLLGCKFGKMLGPAGGVDEVAIQRLAEDFKTTFPVPSDLKPQVSRHPQAEDPTTPGPETPIPDDQPAEEPTGSPVVDGLARLAELRSEGLLSEEEYSEAKRQLLNGS